MQARYYDPVIGRFYSNDPVGFTGEVDTFNRYSYVANNPYKYTDPNGEEKHTFQFSFNIAKGLGISGSFAASYDTTHKEISIDRSFAIKSGAAGKGSGGYTVSESPSKPTGNSGSTAITANLNHSAAIQVGDTTLGVGDSTNLAGVKFGENGVQNISGQPNAVNGGMSTTGEGSINNNVAGAGVDISADVKLSQSVTISIPQTIEKIKEYF